MLRRVTGICGIISQVTILISVLATVSRSPWFSWTQNDLSIFGIKGVATTLFNSGLILTGLFSFIFAIGLRKHSLSGRLPERLGMVSLALGSLALCATGIFSRNIRIPHNCASIAFFTFISLAIFLFGIGALATTQKIWGILSLTAAILIVALLLAPWPWSGGAIPQLLSCAPWSLWTIVFGIRLLLRPRPVIAAPGPRGKE